MADRSRIEWTDATWNPVTGCAKVSQGCKHCYAERDWKRLSANPGTVYYGRAFTDVRCHPERLGQPLRWTKPRMVFVNSMSDLFHEAVPHAFIERVWATMAYARQHVFQILTKRPERMRSVVRDLSDINGRPLPNVWLGVSAEHQAAANERIPSLLETPACVRFVSIEPMLGDIRLGSALQRSPSAAFVDGRATPDMPAWTRIGATAIDWVIVGGESGPNARPMHLDWVRSIRDECAAAGVPFLFKQWGEWLPWTQFTDAAIDDPPEQTRFKTREFFDGHWDDVGYPDYWATMDGDIDDEQCVGRVGKKAAGRLLDGREWNEFPAKAQRC